MVLAAAIDPGVFGEAAKQEAAFQKCSTFGL